MWRILISLFWLYSLITPITLTNSDILNLVLFKTDDICGICGVVESPFCCVKDLSSGIKATQAIVDDPSSTILLYTRQSTN